MSDKKSVSGWRGAISSGLRSVAERLSEKPSETTAVAYAEPLNREQVIWAFRVLLDRDPDDLSIAQRLDCWSNLAELRRELLTTDEFEMKNPAFGFANTSSIVIKELGGGLRLFVDLADRVIGGNVLAGNYEPSELAYMRRTVHTGQTVIDVGANIGFFTVQLASQVGVEGQVYAFEPLASNFDLLRRSVAENRFEQRVTLTPALVGAAAGSGTLIHLGIERAMNSGGSYVAPEGGEVPEGHSATEVATVALDHCEIRRPVSFIKIDVEGSEPLALRGADDLLRTDRPKVLAELNPEQLEKVAACTATDLIAEMAARGYVCRRFTGDGPGEPIEVYTESTICSVLFQPREERASSS